ncbi:MAG: glucosamine-6-phosphate deaminase [Angelakisella sp.]
MKVIVTESFAASCKLVAQKIADLVKEKPNAKLGLATGGTCEDIYANLVRMYREQGLDFSKVHTVNLDEYVGMPAENPLSYRYYMNHHLFDHININKANTYVAGGVGSVDETIAEFRSKIYEGGAPDFQLLGIGVSGHIGFNEAGERLHSLAHEEHLQQSTIDANARYFEDKSKVPTTALTMGVGEISAAAELVLVASGASKVNAIKGLIMDHYVTTHNPSTILKLHPNSVVVIDRELADMVGYQG